MNIMEPVPIYILYLFIIQIIIGEKIELLVLLALICQSRIFGDDVACGYADSSHKESGVHDAVKQPGYGAIV